MSGIDSKTTRPVLLRLLANNKSLHSLINQTN